MSGESPRAGSETDLTLHASCLVLDESGILIRGASGAGKSSLCLELLASAARAGRFARLVGDDRIRLSVRHGRLVARPHPTLAGLIEIRGSGLHHIGEAFPAAVIRLVVDLEQAGERLPDERQAEVSIAGLPFRRLRLEWSQPREYLIREALAELSGVVALGSRGGPRPFAGLDPLA